ACTTWKSVAGEQDGLKGARYARIAAGDLRPCPRPFYQPLCSAMSSMHRCCTSELKRRKIKIDRSFTIQLVGSPKTLAIVRAIAHLSRDLDIELVAEG